MPSSSAPFALHIPKRRIKLVLPDEDIRGRRCATEPISRVQGPDVIPRSDVANSWEETAPVFDIFSPSHEADFDLPRITSLSIADTISAGDMSLSAEPAAPEEREAQDLPPKSYAEAAEEAISSDGDGSSSTTAVAEPQPQYEPLKFENVLDGNIRIQTEEEIQYEGSGMDDSPKSPTRRGHRRKSSLQSNGSTGRKHSEEVKYDIYEKHQIGNGKPLTSVTPSKNVEKYMSKVSEPREELQSGRQAGAGWKKSKYVFYASYSLGY